MKNSPHPTPNSQQVLVVVEIPKGSRNKYEFDRKLGRFKLDRMLFSAVHYPNDYGYILDTWAEDGDPLDAMVIVGEATFPGIVIESKPVGLFKMVDEKGIDWKILCVPLHDPQWNWVNDLSDVPAHLLKEIEHFFAVYKDLEKKKTDIGGWFNKNDALKVIAEASQRFKKRR